MSHRDYCAAELRSIAQEGSAEIDDDSLPEDYDPDDHYPPVGTPETALIVNLTEDQYRVLAHTGRFFHAQVSCAGYQGEEVGIDDVPTDAGFWVFENGEPYTEYDWETQVPDGCGISGTWRKARLADFKAFDYPCPLDLGEPET